MREEKMAWWATGAALLVLGLAMWEVMVGFVLASSILIGLAFYFNAKRKVRGLGKAIIYLILGAWLVVIDLAAVSSIIRNGFGSSYLEIMMVVCSMLLVVLAGYWEKISK
jgi:hypothetical protein